MAFEEEYQKPYQFLLPKHMKRDKFVDMITAICMSHRDMFSEFSDDALDGNGNLNEEYCLGTSHVIACFVAQRTGHSVETECPMSELCFSVSRRLFWNSSEPWWMTSSNLTNERLTFRPDYVMPWPEEMIINRS